jgi:hypothetical protein
MINVLEVLAIMISGFGVGWFTYGFGYEAGRKFEIDRETERLKAKSKEILARYRRKHDRS